MPRETATLAPHPVGAGEAADRAALSHLAAAYGHAIDRRDFALLASLYHPDAIDDHRPYFTGSAADYVAWVPGMLANWRMTSHRVVMALYRIDGDGAEGELSATAYHETLDGARAFIAHGRYVDRYARREGVWRFMHRAFILDWVEDRAIGAPQGYGSEGVAIGRADADDPVYRLLPGFGEERDARDR